MAQNNSNGPRGGFGRRGRLDLDLPKAKLNKENLREAAVLFAYLKPYRGWLVAVCVGLAISGLLSLCFPFLAGSLVDAARPGAALQGPSWLPHHINSIAGLMLAIMAIQAGSTFFHSTTMTRVGQSAVANLRRDTYGRIICLPMSFFGQRRVGELNSRLSADLTQIEATLIMSVPQFFRQALMLLGGIALIAVTSAKLTLIMLCAIPPLIITAVVFGRLIRTNSRATQDKLAETGVIVEETLQGIFNVKSFVNEVFEIGRYGRSMDEYLKVALRGARLRGAFVAFIMFAIFGSIVVVLWSGATMLESGRITYGGMTRFTLYTAFVAGAMGQFADLYSQVQKAVGAAQRVQELLREKPEFPVVMPGIQNANIEHSTFNIQRRTSESPLTPALSPADGGEGELSAAASVGAAAAAGALGQELRGEVEFREVHFRYPARTEIEVLKGISFTVKPGEKIALVGPSGAGKSTIISLLLRFYDPEPGALLVDGRPAPEYPLDWLRNQMSIVPQETLLFGGSIFENIAYGRPGATEAEIVEAAKQANAHDFIMAFPEKYQTVVGERGVKLSGGQRQRVAIARAILKDPVILILDEATSSLDSESERLVQLALDRLMEGRTTFMIAHRLATVRGADRILVIENGTVVESGTHRELNQTENGLYRRLAELQFTEAN